MDTSEILTRLKSSPDSRLLILHADDFGVTESTNEAIEGLLRAGLNFSASLMVPCRGFQNAVELCKKYPQGDYGIHLTLTSEWPSYRWGPLTESKKVSSLIDDSGNFHPNTQEAITKINPEEAYLEMKAQIEKALEHEIRLTHLDSHMLVVFQRPDIFEKYLTLSREFNLLPLVGKRGKVLEITDYLQYAPFLKSMLEPGDPMLDMVIMATAQVEHQTRNAYYKDSLKSLEPGISQLVFHPALENGESIQAFGEAEAKCRQADFDFMAGEEISKICGEKNLQTLNWTKIKNSLQD